VIPAAPQCDPGTITNHGPEVSAVVVYFRTPHTLGPALERLFTQTVPPSEVIVVDNSAAIDGAKAPPLAADGRWRWLATASNIGFGAAVNAGVGISGGDLLLIQNADVELEPTAIERLVSAARADARAAVIGPRLLESDGSVQLSARRFPSAVTGLIGRSSLLTKALRHTGKTPLALSAAQGGAGPVDWVSGACMLLRRLAFAEVGGFDEGFWMYWEDADLCRRLADQGWTAHFQPAAVARHQTGASGQSVATIRAFHESALRYSAKHITSNRVALGAARLALGVRQRVMTRRLARATEIVAR